uniref:Uncharacterized protein n=1 Tax=Chrysemys picta bellii TaxID=8478 RepID=A0A8C3I9B0_CHRPI
LVSIFREKIFRVSCMPLHPYIDAPLSCSLFPPWFLCLYLPAVTTAFCCTSAISLPGALCEPVWRQLLDLLKEKFKIKWDIWFLNELDPPFNIVNKSGVSFQNLNIDVLVH